MTQKFRKGQRVQIIRGYGKPVGKIVKHSRTLNTYDIQGDDGYNYNCISPSDIVLLKGVSMEEHKLFEVELFLATLGTEGDQLTYKFTLKSVSMGALENFIESKRLIRVPHVKGTGVTLVNMDHVSEISIMEAEE